MYVTYPTGTRPFDVVKDITAPYLVKKLGKLLHDLIDIPRH